MLDPVVDITEQICGNANVRDLLTKWYDTKIIPSCPDVYVKGVIIDILRNKEIPPAPFINWKAKYHEDIRSHVIEPIIGTYNRTASDQEREASINQLIACFCDAHSDKDTPTLRSRALGFTKACLGSVSAGAAVHREVLGCITLKCTKAEPDIVYYILGEYVAQEDLMKRIKDRV